MKEVNLIYKGFLKNQYCFTDDDGKGYQFAKANSEIIRQHQLYTEVSIGKNFKAKFFIDSDRMRTSYILCDMELI